MARKGEMTVWAAVIAGMDYCQKRESPLAGVCEFLEKLLVKGWTRAELQEVEQCVVELLTWKMQQPAVVAPRRRKSCSPRIQADVSGRSIELKQATGERVRWKTSWADAIRGKSVSTTARTVRF